MLNINYSASICPPGGICFDTFDCLKMPHHGEFEQIFNPHLLPAPLFPGINIDRCIMDQALSWASNLANISNKDIYPANWYFYFFRCQSLDEIQDVFVAK